MPTNWNLNTSFSTDESYELGNVNGQPNTGGTNWAESGASWDVVTTDPIVGDHSLYSGAIVSYTTTICDVSDTEVYVAMKYSDDETMTFQINFCDTSNSYRGPYMGIWVPGTIAFRSTAAGSDNNLKVSFTVDTWYTIGMYLDYANSRIKARIKEKGGTWGSYSDWVALTSWTKTDYLALNSSVDHAMWIGYIGTTNPDPDPVAPTVTTQAVTDRAATTGTANGNITATGGANATIKGVCWKVGSSGDPTTADSSAHTDGDFGTGAFTQAMTGLTSGTIYRVRPYATNSAGTSYGTTVSYTTAITETTTYRVRAYATNSEGTSYGETVDVTTLANAQSVTTTLSASSSIKVIPAAKSVTATLASTLASKNTSIINSVTTSLSAAYSRLLELHRTHSITVALSSAATNITHIIISGIGVTLSAAKQYSLSFISAVTTTLTGSSSKSTASTKSGTITLTGLTIKLTKVLVDGLSLTLSAARQHGLSIFASVTTALSATYSKILQLHRTHSATVTLSSPLVTNKPDAPTNFVLSVVSPNQINITWTKGLGAEKTMIRRATGAYPTISTGTLIYNDVGTSYNDTGLTTQTTYYYRAWSSVESI